VLLLCARWTMRFDDQLVNPAPESDEARRTNASLFAALCAATL
jgi:hypothetical protein